MTDLAPGREERPRILIVCASEMVLHVLTDRLSVAGYFVTGCSDGWKARSLVAANRFSLAILDVPLAREPAQGLIEMLRASNPRITVLTLGRPVGKEQSDGAIPDAGVAEATSLLETVARLIAWPGPPALGGKR